MVDLLVIILLDYEKIWQLGCPCFKWEINGVSSINYIFSSHARMYVRGCTWKIHATHQETSNIININM